MELMKPTSGHPARETPSTQFGAAVKATRVEKKVSQVELASRIGSTQSLVSAYEAGEHEPPRETVFAIEVALDVPAGSLSRFLGYLPVNYEGRAPLSFRDFLMRDEATLSPEQRRVFLDLYRQFTAAETTPRAPRKRVAAAAAKSTTRRR